MGISHEETRVGGASRKRRSVGLPKADRITLGVMAGIPLIITAALITASKAPAASSAGRR